MPAVHGLTTTGEVPVPPYSSMLTVCWRCWSRASSLDLTDQRLESLNDFSEMSPPTVQHDAKTKTTRRAVTKPVGPFLRIAARQTPGESGSDCWTSRMNCSKTRVGSAGGGGPFMTIRMC